MNILAVIGARAGSVRCPGKNHRWLPDDSTLIGRAVTRAHDAGFQHIVLSTDDPAIIKLHARRSGDAPDPWLIVRPDELATAETRDAEWVAHALHELGGDWDAVAIIRPTSPFLKAETVRRGVEMFEADKGVYCIKTVRPVSESPWKMWDGYGWQKQPLRASPHKPYSDHAYDKPTSHEGLWIQTGGLDIVPVTNIREGHLVGSSPVRVLVVDGWEGLDINTEMDWLLAETAIERGLVDRKL